MLSNRLKSDGKPTYVLNALQQKMKLEVEQKIADEVYQFETVDCVVCGDSEATKIAEKDRYGLFFPVVSCKSCGLVRTNPRMNQASYNEFYNTEYRKLYVGQESPTGDFFKLQMQKGKLIYDYLEEKGAFHKAKKDMFVLEVGCGAGGILHFFREKGCTVKGIDLGEEYINYGKEEYDLDLEVGFLSDLNLDRKPDLVIYSHIVEHILEPDAEFIALNKAINRDTIVYVEVPGIKHLYPNYDMNLLRYLQNAHTFHFSLTTLQNLMEKCGYEMLAGTEYIRSIFRPTDQKNDQFKNDYNAVITYLEKMEKKKDYFALTPFSLKKRLESIVVPVLDFLRIKKLIKSLLGK
jgi:2-polyprenyl-3-methyl-5-hydroxy-6-metoxy-1,4-benzoquinol methylase